MQWTVALQKVPKLSQHTNIHRRLQQNGRIVWTSLHRAIKSSLFWCPNDLKEAVWQSWPAEAKVTRLSRKMVGTTFYVFFTELCIVCKCFNGAFRPLFIYFRSFQTIYWIKTADFSRIRTRIVAVGKRRARWPLDHTTAQPSVTGVRIASSLMMSFISHLSCFWLRCGQRFRPQS